MRLWAIRCACVVAGESKRDGGGEKKTEKHKERDRDTQREISKFRHTENVKPDAHNIWPEPRAVALVGLSVSRSKDAALRAERERRKVPSVRP